MERTVTLLEERIRSFDADLPVGRYALVYMADIVDNAIMRDVPPQYQEAFQTFRRQVDDSEAAAKRLFYIEQIVTAIRTYVATHVGRIIFDHNLAEEIIRDIDPFFASMANVIDEENEELARGFGEAVSEMEPQAQAPNNDVARALGPIFQAMRVRQRTVSDDLYQAKAYLREARNDLNKIYESYPEGALNSNAAKSNMISALEDAKRGLEEVIRSLRGL